MKLEKIDESKIKVTISQEKFNKKRTSYNNINCFYLEILEKAEKELNFYTDGFKLLIETFNSSNDTLILTITKFIPNNIKTNKKKNTIPTLIYKFENFDNYCKLCNYLKFSFSDTNFNKIDMNFMLYYYNNNYFLIIKDKSLNYSIYKKILATISEFSTPIYNTYSFKSKLIERGLIIMSEKSLSLGIKYFSQPIKDRY